MKNHLFFILLLSLISSIHAQSDKNVEDHQFKINFINPGIDYEVGIGKDQTLDFGIALQFGARGGYDHLYWALIPAFNAQYRYYYNLDRRITKNKRTAGNTGNYIALNNTTFFNERIIGNLNTYGGYFGYVGSVYGIQRTYAKGFSFNLKFGIGYYYDDYYEGQFGPILGLSVGWVPGKKRR